MLSFWRQAPFTIVTTFLATTVLATVLAAAPAREAAAGAARAAGPPKIPPGMAAGYLVFDRETGKVALAYRPHARFRSASVVKILIALDHLESRDRGTRIPAGDRDLLRRMLRASDDAAATALWNRGGKGAIINRMARRLGLADAGPPPAAKPGFWGYTAISAADVVRTYRYLLDRAKPKVRDLILGHLREATRCAADDFDQYFGIPRAVPRPWAVKQGWSGFGARPSTPCGATRATTGTAPATLRPPVNFSRPVLHTTGLAGKGDRLIMAVLTLQPPGSSYQRATTRLTTLTRAIYRSARPH